MTWQMSPNDDSRESKRRVCYEPDIDAQYAVSWRRADEIRAQWATARTRWLLERGEAKDFEALEWWAETFAPDHPEWFEENADPVARLAAGGR